MLTTAAASSSFTSEQTYVGLVRGGASLPEGHKLTEFAISIDGRVNSTMKGLGGWESPDQATLVPVDGPSTLKWRSQVSIKTLQSECPRFINSKGETSIDPSKGKATIYRVSLAWDEKKSAAECNVEEV